MRLFLKFLQFIFSIYALCTFLVFMLVLFPFVVIASLFGKVTGGNMVYHICRFWADGCLFLWGIRHKNINNDSGVATKPYVFVFNHISYIDIPVILVTFRNQPIRILAKAEMARMPIFGFIYKTATVMVDRSDSSNRMKSVETLKTFLKQNISVVIAPEGTFNMTHRPLKEFYDGAFKIAIETNTFIKPVIFLDDYDRLNYNSIFSLTPGRSRSVFLEEIDSSGYTPETMEALKQKVFAAMEAGLIEYKASWITEKSSNERT